MAPRLGNRDSIIYIIRYFLSGTLGNGENWRKQAFKCQLVQVKQISLGFSLFKIALGATMKTLVGQILPVGHMFDTPDLDYEADHK